jgi:hypothetical protein
MHNDKFKEKAYEEILKRIEERKGSDPFGWEINELIFRLSFETAKPFLKDGAKRKNWEPEGKDRESLLKTMLEYMPFAWEKANGCRGLSAGRSLAHYQAWVWLMGDDLGDLTEYECYGKDNLIKICEHYGWDHKQWDDDVRSNKEYYIDENRKIIFV